MIKSVLCPRSHLPLLYFAFILFPWGFSHGLARATGGWLLTPALWSDLQAAGLETWGSECLSLKMNPVSPTPSHPQPPPSPPPPALGTGTVWTNPDSLVSTCNMWVQFQHPDFSFLCCKQQWEQSWNKVQGMKTHAIHEEGEDCKKKKKIVKCLHNNELLFNNSRAQPSTGNISFCESHSVMSDSLWTHALYSPWNSPGQNTGEVSLSVLQGIFPTQGLNPSELQMDYLPAEAPGKPKKYGMLHEFVCHPCAGAMTNFSVSLQFQYMCCQSKSKYLVRSY